MKGLAMLLKALYPTLDWSTPEATIKSIVPSFDLVKTATELQTAGNAIVFMAQQVDARLTRIEQNQRLILEVLNAGRTYDSGSNYTLIESNGLIGAGNSTDPATDHHN